MHHMSLHRNFMTVEDLELICVFAGKFRKITLSFAQCICIQNSAIAFAEFALPKEHSVVPFLACSFSQCHQETVCLFNAPPGKHTHEV